MSSTQRETAPTQMQAAERNPAKGGLVSQYRAIGPAAVLAAVLANKKRKTLKAEPRPAYADL